MVKKKKFIAAITIIMLLINNINIVALADEADKTSDFVNDSITTSSVMTTTAPAIELEKSEGIQPEGKGSEEEPYLIKTALNLKWISENNNKFEGFDDIYFKQSNNIDMNNILIDPIGTTENYFNGYYDGNLTKIYNLKINSEQKYVGLFGRVKYPVIKNIILENADITSTNQDGYLGGIIGYSKAIDIINCHITKNSKITGISQNVGGIVGSINDTTIKDCTFDGIVSSSAELDNVSTLGGIVGISEDTSDIINCHIIKNAVVRGIGNISYTGGIVGYVDVNRVERCSSYGSVEFNLNQYSGNGINIGGLVGMMGTYSSQAIINCLNASKITVIGNSDKKTFVGGIMGGFDYSNKDISNIIKNSISIGELPIKNTYTNIGGILGFLSIGGYDFKESFYLDTTADNSLGNAQTLDGKVINSPKSKGALETASIYSLWDNNIWDIKDGEVPTLKNMPNINFEDEEKIVPQKTKKTASSGAGVVNAEVVLNSTNIKVNGTDKNAGKVEKLEINGESITRITVDSDILKKLIEHEENKPLITIPFSDNDICENILTGQIIKDMQAKEAIVEIKNSKEKYTLPASAIDIDYISTKLGKTVQLKDIKVNIRISELSNSKFNNIKDKLENDNTKLISIPVEFNISCVYDKNSISLEIFNEYVVRSIAIPKDMPLDKITTGVTISENGELLHVPTTITEENGRYFANINSITNSIYAVVWNHIEFRDIENHWAKDDINDMGSRMAVEGIDKETFLPNRNITRAEFATFIVKSFGLKTENKSNIFQDVSENDRYSKYINVAAEYGIVGGYSNHLFKPESYITREEAMSIITRAINFTKLNDKVLDKDKNLKPLKFNDSSNISKFAKESVDFCINSRIVRGKTDKLIAPKDFITRAEATVIIQRILQTSNLINSKNL